VLHRRGDRRQAAELDVRAAALSARCEGAITPGSAAPASSSPLTPRERDVALLAARGLSSRAIAERLVVSVRTVDNNLQRAYTKLGITGRGQLADSLVRVGVTPADPLAPPPTSTR
jgi:DNA-binding CsgD family transcriptional regulator